MPELRMMMVVLKTEQNVYRFCHFCHSPMTIMKETAHLLIAHCPKWTERDRNHELVICQDQVEGPGTISRELYEYFRDLLMPGMGAREG